MSGTNDKLRVDKWLWHARFFKTRTLAASRVKTGNVRINGTTTHKPSSTVCKTDVLTFAQGDDIRVIQIDALGERRGPAPEAQTLYTDLSPPQPKEKNIRSENPAFDGKGRPTKKDRRTLDLSKARHLE
ncbi:S4 domain protein [Sulfitobacter noctilucicola]|uniref:Ribosome-associated heat shock protein Hsp15 n=1 Tax=Sulfitobacter noctilucicola TaxID=1342301 RepID=A0A7W6Q705_9RHOB|nr:RNA-binding S4 domain-containing protein [Sulfitobacter noctilucicola]KIN64019.1 S4 domain protein [Sulfitobacter noctilucicola]MBB4175375.1 ribosome-associated heat shock protein Hsp15 [Sulfitobacter noctilucicola]